MSVPFSAPRSARMVAGPFPITANDIAEVNAVFSDSFTERYRRDGMVGVRVPALNHAIWRFSIEDAGDGAMLWRDAEGSVAAFNVAHRSGIEGWMGPIVVRTDLQHQGVGKRIVKAGIDWLTRAGAQVIGLETMPRTVDNIGFYASLGFVPGPLTVTFTVEASGGDLTHRIGKMHEQHRDHAVEECAQLTRDVAPGYDFTREIQLTAALRLGDTLLLRADDGLHGFAICHTAALVEGRAPEELRVLKIVLRDVSLMADATRAIARYARESALQRAAIRIQGNCHAAFEAVVAEGGRVRWTDLRMTLRNYPEIWPARGVVMSNWEI